MHVIKLLNSVLEKKKKNHLPRLKNFLPCWLKCFAPTYSYGSSLHWGLLSLRGEKQFASGRMLKKVKGNFHMCSHVSVLESHQLVTGGARIDLSKLYFSPVTVPCLTQGSCSRFGIRDPCPPHTQKTKQQLHDQEMCCTTRNVWTILSPPQNSMNSSRKERHICKSFF